MASPATFASPAKVWGSRFEWTRNGDGSVMVRNPRTRCQWRYRNMGAALAEAKDTKRNAAEWERLRRLIVGR